MYYFDRPRNLVLIEGDVEVVVDPPKLSCQGIVFQLVPRKYSTFNFMGRGGNCYKDWSSVSYFMNNNVTVLVLAPPQLHFEFYLNELSQYNLLSIETTHCGILRTKTAVFYFNSPLK